MYVQCNVKRQKVTRDAKVTESSENFPGIGKIEYKPDYPHHSADDALNYRYYNGTERIQGRCMEDWLKPSLYIGRAFTPKDYYPKRPWSERLQTVDNYKRSIRAAFELCMKMGIKFWSAYDSDLAPIGDNIEDTNKNYDQIVELIFDYQQKTGIKPLWIGVDFLNVHFKNGAITNPDFLIVSYAGHKIKRVIDIAQKLNAECVLICGLQEGFHTQLNTDISRDLKFMAKFYKLIVDYKEKVGFNGQLLLQTVYDKEQWQNINFYSDVDDDMQKQYYMKDMFSTLTFLKHFNLDRFFKLNVKPGVDFNMANAYNCFGSIDIMHELNPNETVLLLKSIVERGGYGNNNLGGMTFYLPQHDGSFDAKDFIEYSVDMLDRFGKCLRIAIKLVNDPQINKSVQLKYQSFTTGWGAKLLNADVKLEECETQIGKFDERKGELYSERSEHWACLLNRFIDAPLM